MREFEEFIRAKTVERIKAFDLLESDVATKVGISRASVNKFVNGNSKAQIKFQTLCQFAKWLGIEVVMSWRERGSEGETHVNVGA